MPQGKLDPSEKRTRAPRELRAARRGKRWEHVDRVGDWEDVVPTKPETQALTKAEKARGLLKLDREVKVRDGKLEVLAELQIETDPVKEEGDVKPDRVRKLR